MFPYTRTPPVIGSKCPTAFYRLGKELPSDSSLSFGKCKGHYFLPNNSMIIPICITIGFALFCTTIHEMFISYLSYLADIEHMRLCHSGPRASDWEDPFAD